MSRRIIPSQKLVDLKAGDTPSDWVLRVLQPYVAQVYQQFSRGAVLDAANEFTDEGGGSESAVNVVSSSPAIGLRNTSGATDEKQWDFHASATSLLFRTVNDANSATVNWLVVERTGTAVDEVEINTTAFDLNADADISGGLRVNGGEIRSYGANGSIRFQDSGSTANNRVFDWVVVSDSFRGRLIDDAESTANSWISVERTGQTVDSITLAATAIIFSGRARLTGFTVATLPAGTIGDLAYVTDALAPAYNAALVGGGAIPVKAFYNGVAWVAG